ncbi:putative DCC family thiol-disulfide oxidoreductase YuxK [Nakamurella sp. UYEF19]|uniref:thiol-disulfide oxidoreductase DCC family protein n=1 Tax=Nakamurella sp. UYEF19 TaxID=1756392 RepID=UPI003395AA6F
MTPGLSEVTGPPVSAGPPVIIYDGDCGFCQWSLVQGRRFLTVMPSAEALQNADLAGYGLTMAQAMAAVQFVAADRTVTAGHEAAASVLMWQPRFGWRLLGSLMTVPPVSWLAALAYRWVAGHRYLLPGHSDACAVPVGP